MQATEGLASSSADLNASYTQAFSGKTTADNIKNVITFKVAGINFTKEACSTVGLIVGGVAGIAAIVAAAPSGGSSLAAFVATKGAEAAATAGIVYLLQQQLLPIAEDKAVVPDIISGPLGGGVLAYGARELGNIDARSSGGVALAGTETSTVSPAEQTLENQEFNSRSLFAKLFDAKDYRSVAGRLVDNTSTNFFQNLAKMGSAMFHFNQVFSWGGQIFVHKALAAQSYNWGSPRYGIPNSLATAPSYENSYANAEYVAKNSLDPDAPNPDDVHGMSYFDKVRACFGDSINKDSENKWQVVPSSDVNPGSSDYTGAHCDDTNSGWQRLMLFVSDSRNMDAAACYAGDAQSCTNTGATN